MIGLLLVEDEEAIKQKLVQNINWVEYGFNPVLSAANGVEALELLEQNKIGIMVTDVQMPKLNGIELLKEIKRRNYSIKIIVISGFAEFEYAQESIKLSVSDYLLKPFASRRLLEIVLRLKKELLQEEAQENELTNLRRQLSQNIVSLKEKFFMDLLGGNIGAGNMDAQLEFLGLEGLKDRLFQVAVIEIPENEHEEQSEEEKYLLNMQLYQEISEILETAFPESLVINLRRNQVVGIIMAPASDLPVKLEEILGQLKAALNHPLACGVGHLYHDLPDLLISYKEACSALQYQYLYGLNRVFSINDINLTNSSYHKIFYQLHRNPIFDCLKIGADQAIRKELAALIIEMRGLKLSSELSKIVASNLVLLTYTTLNELGYHSGELAGLDFSVVTEIGKARTLDELEKTLVQFFEKINQMIRHKRSSHNCQLIEEIRQLIDEQYFVEISLSAIAVKYNISPGYLSLLFTERTGKKFSDYLAERRIKKAQELLKHTNKKVYEISGEVGYNDSFYFSNCFKKLTGFSPSEYREKVNGSR